MNSPVAISSAELVASAMWPFPVAVHDFDPLVARYVLVEDSADVRLGGTVVGDAEFPVRVLLFENRIDDAAQPFFRRIVDRCQDGKHRFVRHGLQRGADLECGADSC
jgi:hypothetical protein